VHCGELFCAIRNGADRTRSAYAISLEEHIKNSEGGSVAKFSRSTIALILLTTSLTVLAQTTTPKLIDVHEHFNGDSSMLQVLLPKLNAADGLAILLVTPKGVTVATKFIQEYPDRFIGFGSIKLDDSDVLTQIDSFHKAGFRGLGEITSGLKNYDDRSYWPIYDRAAKYHMILLFHTGIFMRGNPDLPQDVSFDRMRATRLDLIARHWPKTIIIGAHLGNPDYAEAAEIARLNPNLYFDLSGTSLVKKRGDYGFFRSVFWWGGIIHPNVPPDNAFEKLVFGSDTNGGHLADFDEVQERYHAMLDACQVPPDVQAKVFSGTMWRILQEQKKAIAADTGN